MQFFSFQLGVWQKGWAQLQAVEFILFLTSKKVSIMNFAERQSLQYEVSLNSFREESIDKRMLLEKMEFDFSSKPRGKTPSKADIANEVKFCRRNIEEIERILRDIESYFIDLKLEFIHQLFSTIFKIMIISYKALAEKFIAYTQQKKKDELEFMDRSPDPKLEQKERLKKNTASEMKYFDAMIKHLEEEENRLSEKRNIVERQLVFEKEIIHNITASDAVQQIGVLIRQFDRIIVQSEMLSDSEGQFNAEDPATKLNLINRLDCMPQQYCDNIETTTKKKFMAAMERLVKKLYQQVRETEKEAILKEINMDKKLRQCKSVQTDKSQVENVKDRTKLLQENDSLRKTNSALRTQTTQLREQIQKMSKLNDELTKKLEISTDLISKKSQELHKSKIDFEYSLSKKDTALESLTKKISELRSENNLQSLLHTQGFQMQDTNTRLQIPASWQKPKSQSEQSKSNSKLRNTLRDKSHHASFYFEKQFKNSKKENGCLRKSLIIMLDTLKDQKLIVQYPLNDLNDDLKKGILADKIQALSLEILNNVKDIKMSVAEKAKAPRSAARKKTSIMASLSSTDFNNKRGQIFTQMGENVNIGVQTDAFLINDLLETIKHRPDSRAYQTTQQKKQNKLELLKKQLLNKVISKKNASLRKRAKKQSNQHSNFVQNSTSMDMWRSMEIENKQNRNKSNNKSKIVFGGKDVSFQEFKFTSPENKATYEEKMKNQAKFAKDRSHQRGFYYEANAGINEQDPTIEQQNKETGMSSPMSSEQPRTEMQIVIKALDAMGLSNSSNQAEVKKVMRKMLAELNNKKTNEKNSLVEAKKMQMHPRGSLLATL